jgi:hypothetical protein
MLQIIVTGLKQITVLSYIIHTTAIMNETAFISIKRIYLYTVFCFLELKRKFGPIAENIPKYLN